MVNEELEQYLGLNTSPEPDLLSELRRETHLKTAYPQMLSGPVQGKLLEFISHMLRPHTILEIGTFTGYSALCLAQGLADGGKLHTIEINPELIDFAARYFRKSGLWAKIIQHTGDALKIIPALEERFDLVFMDASKEHYPDYFALVADRINSGGFLVADNVLWSGKVLLPESEMDRETTGITTFNKLLSRDERFENVMLPLRDGITLARKV